VRTIDIHTHGIEGYDTRTTSAEDILEIARIQGSQGVTAILPAIYSGPIDEMRRHMAVVKQAMAIQVDLMPSPSTIHYPPSTDSVVLGVHLEGPFLNPSRCGALDPASFLNPTPDDNLSRLIEGFEDMVRIITVAPELDGAIRLIKAASDLGITVSMGHSDATFAEAEAGFHAGAKGITHIFNAMRPFHHREPGIAGFGLINKDVYVEVIADPFHLHPETIKLIFAMKDPQKIVVVSDSVKETPKSARFNPALGGTIENRKSATAKMITDSQGTLQGGSMTITEAADRLIGLGIEKDRVLRCVSSNPASYHGIVL